MNSNDVSEVFDTFALVEVLGRNEFAGRVTEQTIAGRGFIRVDIPAIGDQQAFTKFFGTDSIYAITPMSEEMVLAYNTRNQQTPISVYQLRQLQATNEVPDDEDEQYDSDF